MYWHIDTDIVSLLVMCALYVYNLRLMPRDKRTLRDERFLVCLRVGVIVTIIDIAASVAMEVPVSPVLYHALMLSYYIGIELVIVSWVYYVIVILYHNDEQRRRRVSAVTILPFLLYSLSVLSNPWTGLYYTLGPDNAYARGPGFVLMLAVYTLYAVGLLVGIYLRRRHIPARYPGWVLTLIPVIVALAVAVQLSIPGWLMVMPAYMFCLVMAYLFLQSVRIQRDREERRLLRELIEHVSCGFAVSRISPQHRLEIEYLNDGYYAICEAAPGQLSARYARDILAGIHPDDQAMAKQKLDELALERRGHEMLYRYITDAGRQKWIYVQAKVVEHEDGWATAYSTFTDLTEQIQLQRQLADVIHTVPCGICLYSWDGERMHPLLANAQLSEMFGFDAMEHLESIGGLDYQRVHPEDRDGLLAASLKALSHTHTIDYTFRIRTGEDESYRWLRERGILVAQPDGTQLAYVSYYDVTQEHMAEQRLRESEQALEYAAAQAGLWCWRYDAQNDRVYPDGRGQREFGLPTMVEALRFDRPPKGRLTPEGRALYLDACRRIQAGEEQVSFELQIETDEGTPRWFRCCLANLFDGQGVPTATVGTAISIDAEKELWAKYELERQRTAIESENLIAHAVFNLSTGETLEYAFRDGSAVPKEMRYALDYSRDKAELLIDDEERRQFLELNDRAYLLERFARGETEFRLDYRRIRHSGLVSWVRSALHLLREPRSGDILLFEYWYDVEEEKMLELMYRSLASENYDYVARINGMSRQFAVVSRTGLTHHMPPASGEDADLVAVTHYNEDVVPEDRQMAIESSLVANIKQNLRRSGRYQFTYRVLRPDGSLRYKRITQYYIDPKREIIMMTREDVTELIHAEAEKNELLAAALTAARQASEAKSQFLSRVSHELRTPLNAIIGFIELSKDADERQLRTYLANSDLAAKQLLSIINDVLDMSAIESGKLKLAHAPFDFKQLIHSVTNMYLAQCQQKGLGFDTKLLTPLDEWLVGDPLRVNQILMNLLGNALKFTEHGSVQLLVSQSEASAGHVLVRFEIVDTGCGISEEMLPRLFTPFEQETPATAQRYGGSGLGLSIVSNLVSMMGGTVRVESRQGVGSAFTVELPFARSQSQRGVEALSGVEELRVLAVDDELGEREYLSLVLTRMGVRHHCVPDGDAALAALASAQAARDAYNLCLIDWKMPGLDGIETTRRIREKYGENLILIVISAYEHHQADESARSAGANLFVTKPLFQSSLFDLFSNLTGGRIARRQSLPERVSFAGRRVLLAEDNAMNRIVAEGLIRRLGAHCDSAEDGSIALEKYLAAPEGYYDAVLMDIQMPNMDGFAATAAIRASGRADAGTLPIIALTANALTQDIAETLSAGMNAHVAKPIEPVLLAKALEGAFGGGEGAWE